MSEVPMAEEHGSVPVLPRKRGRSAAAFGAGIVLAAAAGVVAYFLVGGAGQKAPLAPAAPAPAVAPAPVAQPKTAPIEGSEPGLRDWAHQVSGAAVFEPFFSAGDLARRVVAVIYGVSEGNVPRRVLASIAPSGEFAVEDQAGAKVISEKSFHRYDPVAEAFGSANMEAAARAFTAIEPVLETAHREIAPPGRTVRQSLRSAIDQLLATPVPSQRIEVTEKGALYQFADPELEALTPAQKQLLRFGPRNQQLIQRQLRSFLSALHR